MSTIITKVKAHPDLYGAMLVVCCALVPMLTWLTAGLAPKLDEPESLAEWLPYRIFINRAFAQGILPAWCPDLLAGIPFIAWAHSSVFAPFGVIYYFLPYAQAATIAFFLSAALFGLGVRFLCRVFSVSSASAVAAAVAAMAFFMAAEQVQYLPRMLSLSLVPYMFGLLATIVRRPRLTALLAFSLVAAIQVFNGDLEIFGRTLTLAVLFGALFIPFSTASRRLPSMLMPALTALALIIVLALPVLLPNLELIDLSTRQIVYPYEFYANISGRAAIMLFLPALAMTPLLSLSLPALLAFRRDRFSLILALIVGICFAVADNFRGTLHLVRLIPVLNRLLWHIHMVPLATVALALAAGMALDRIRSSSSPAYVFSSLVLSAAWATIAVLVAAHSSNPVTAVWPGLAALATLLPLLFLHRAALGRQAIIASAIIGSWLGGIGLLTPIHPSLLDHDPSYPEFISRLPKPSRALNLTNHTYYHSMRIPYQAGIYHGSQSFDFYIQVMPLWSYDFLNLIRPFWRLDDKRKAVELFDMFKHGDFIRRDNLKFLNLLNLVGLATDHENLRLAEDYRLAYFLHPDACRPSQCLIEDTTHFPAPRVALSAPGVMSHTVDFAQLREISFSLLPPERSRLQYQLVSVINRIPRLLFSRSLGQAEPTSTYNVALRLGDMESALEFIALPEGAPSDAVWINPTLYRVDPYFKLVRAVGDIRYYLNPGALPRAFMVHQAVVIPDRQERLDFMKSEKFTPSSVVTLERGMPLAMPNFIALEDQVVVTEHRPGRVLAKAKTNSPGLFIVTDTWYPGWRAWDNEQEVPILRANHAFNALRLSSGHHEIELRYEPRSLRIGIWTALAAYLAAAAALGWRSASARKPDLSTGDNTL